MNKNNLILKYFQKKDLLTVQKTDYRESITALFRWLIDNDRVKDDKTTSFFPKTNKIEAKIVSGEEAILAGIEELNFLLSQNTKLLFKHLVKDGEKATKGKILAEIKGEASEILAYERTVLNILQRMSGIATETNRLITSFPFPLHPFPLLAATRKTPWMMLDKKAVAVAGGLTHRLSLSDGIIIKDNHLIAIKNEHKLKTTEEAVSKALEMITRKAKGELIEIEVRTEKEAFAALSAFQKYNANNHLSIMFDNFSPLSLKSVLNNLSSSKGRSTSGRNSYDLSSIIIEASGGIDKNNICQWAKTGVDLISMGSLTHSSSAANISLEF